MNAKFKLSNEKRSEMIALIKEYFLKERDEELGDLSAILILDFFVEKLASEFYNLGVYDSYKYTMDKVEDLLGILKY